MDTEQFHHLVSYREVDYEGVKELLWVTKDRGAFGNKRDGPLFDWIDGHKDFMSEVKDFHTVIQAGGNCGMYARFYANYFKNIISFEPDELNFYCLERNCVGDKYTLYNGGLGNRTDKLSLNRISQTNVGMHKIKEIPGDIQMYRIDDLNVERCDLLHLDIEGYEENALRGSIKTIEKFRPVIITEKSSAKSYLETIGYREHKVLRWDTIFVYDK
jgi:FkbM family methyltransferase